MHRSKMSPKEREWRSRLAKLVHQQELARGSLTVRKKLCGKANCKCTRGEKHEALYLVYTDEGRVRQIYIPRKWHAQARQWVAQYRKVEDLLKKISAVYCDRLHKRRQ